MEEVILVDEQDNEIGTMEKMDAHRRGALHRAFSIFIFNTNGEVLLQKRSLNKYHSGGLWTNACCSHPLPGETMENATKRKLKQEMGIEVKTSFAYKFIYKTGLDHDLIEHECDHVFTGIFNGIPAVNREEVEDWKFADLKFIQDDIHKNPDAYTYWFKLIVAHPAFKSIELIA